MSDTERLRRAFLVFHVMLGLTLLWSSTQTLFHLGPTDLPARIIGSIEALGAVGFLVPRTIRFGAALLLLSLVGAFILHAAQFDWRPDLLVYASGVALVAVHGSTYRGIPSVASAA